MVPLWAHNSWRRMAHGMQSLLRRCPSLMWSHRAVRSCPLDWLLMASIPLPLRRCVAFDWSSWRWILRQAARDHGTVFGVLLRERFSIVVCCLCVAQCSDVIVITRVAVWYFMVMLWLVLPLCSWHVMVHGHLYIAMVACRTSAVQRLCLSLNLVYIFIQSGGLSVGQVSSRFCLT
jgi:hypothetical protein